MTLYFSRPGLAESQVQTRVVRGGSSLHMCRWCGPTRLRSTSSYLCWVSERPPLRCALASATVCLPRMSETSVSSSAHGRGALMYRFRCQV